MSYVITFTKIAVHDYKILQEPYKTQIKTKIELLRLKGLNQSNIKALQGQLKGSYRLRSGIYRIMFKIDRNMILIESIRHRKDIYE